MLSQLLLLTVALLPPAHSDIYDREHTKSDLPTGGEFISHPKNDSKIYYFTNPWRMWKDKTNAQKQAGLYRSSDGGRTWKLLCYVLEFKKLFIHPDTGRLFAIIKWSHLETDPKDGFLQLFITDKAVASVDGRHWKDVTGKHRYYTGLIDIFKDPDHSDRVCLKASMVRGYILQSTNENYEDWNMMRMDRDEGRRIMHAAGLQK